MGTSRDLGGFWVNLLNNNGLVVQSIRWNPMVHLVYPVLNQSTYSILLSNMEVARGVRPPAHTLTLPEGWTFTRTFCSRTSSLGLSGVYHTRSYHWYNRKWSWLTRLFVWYKRAYRVKGAVFHDSDGLNGDIPDVDGNSINWNASDYVTQNNPALYVSAIDQFSKIFANCTSQCRWCLWYDASRKDVINLQLTMRKRFPGELLCRRFYPG